MLPSLIHLSEPIDAKRKRDDEETPDTLNLIDLPNDILKLIMAYTEKCDGDSVFNVNWIRQVSSSILQVVVDSRLPTAVMADVKAALRNALAAHYKGPPGFFWDGSDVLNRTIRLLPTEYSKNMPDDEVDELASRVTTEMATALGFTVEDDARYFSSGLGYGMPSRHAWFHVCRYHPTATPPSKMMRFTQ